MAEITEIKKLYEAGDYEACFSSLYKQDTKTKLLVWTLIIFSFLLSVLSIYLSLNIRDNSIAVVVAAIVVAAAIAVAAIAVVAAAADVFIAAAAVVVAAAIVAAIVAAITVAVAVAVAAAAIAVVVVAAIVVVVVVVADNILKKWCKYRIKILSEK